MTPAQIEQILQRPLNHVGWMVEDLEAAAAHWSAAFGVGPFVLVEGAVLDETSHKGAPCTFEHSAAFSKWGDLNVELQHFTKCEPYAVAHGWGVGKGDHVNHVSYTVPDPDAESERLEALGMSRFLTWKDGPLHANVHRAPFFGPCLEVHTDGTLDDFWKAVGEAVAAHDGPETLIDFALPFK